AAAAAAVAEPLDSLPAAAAASNLLSFASASIDTHGATLKPPPASLSRGSSAPSSSTASSPRSPLLSSPTAAYADAAAAASPPSNTIALAVVFAIAVVLMVVLFRYIPDVSAEDGVLLRFPRSLSDVRVLSSVLRKYRDANYSVVLAGFCALYIFLQS